MGVDVFVYEKGRERKSDKSILTRRTEILSALDQHLGHAINTLLPVVLLSFL